MEGFRLKIAHGLSYGLAGRAVLAAFQIITSLATARYLTPEDFGVVAFALVYINFLAQFSDLGISTAVVQLGKEATATFSVAFTLKAITGALLTLLGIIAGIGVALFGAAPSGQMICLLSLSFILGAATFLPHLRLTIDLDYRRLFLVSLVAAASSTGVLLVLLAVGWRYWAIGFAFIVSILISAIHLNLIRPVRPRFCWDYSILVPLIKFGFPIFLTGIFGFLVLYGGNLVISIFSGIEALGFYAIAFTFSYMVVNQVAGMFGVLFPIYSKNQDDKVALRTMFLHGLDYTAAIAVLVNVGLMSLSEPFFYHVLGDGSDKWFPALDTFLILCINGILAAVLFSVGPLVVALGKPQAQLRAIAVSAAVQGVLIVPGLHYAGIEGVAAVLILGSLAQIAVYAPVLKKEVMVGLSDTMRALAPAALAGLAMVIVSRLMFWVLPKLAQADASFVSIGLQALVLLAVFLAMHGVLTKWRLLIQIRDLMRGATLESRAL